MRWRNRLTKASGRRWKSWSDLQVRRCRGSTWSAAMNIQIDGKTLAVKQPVAGESWRVWERKTFNLHRGVIEFPIPERIGSIDEIARQIRAGVKLEFRPGW